MPEEPREPLDAPRAESPEAQRLRQAASEMILSGSNLTDELTDDEAQPLILWAVRQAEAAADDLVLASLDGEASPAMEPGEILADRLHPVRRMMTRINRLVSNRHDLPKEDLREELQYLFLLAEELPRPPQGTALPVQATELISRQADLENRAFVQAVIGLLEVSPCSDATDRTPESGQGE